MKPKVFVASSVENLNIAYAVQENLQYAAEVTVWTQGIFGLSNYVLVELLSALSKTDFGIFVLGADDVVKMRGVKYQTTRDNVIFEMGLSIGKLGRERNYIVMPEDNTKLHLPTDLLGLEPAKYDPNRSDRNLNAALGPACSQISRAIQQMPLKSPYTTLCENLVGGWWESVQDGNEYSLSFAMIELAPDINSVQIIGRVFNHTSEEVASWHTEGCCLDPSNNRFFYYWQGSQDGAQGLNGGYGEIMFERANLHPRRGHGFFSDSRKKSTRLIRASDEEIAIMHGNAEEAIRRLVTAKLASFPSNPT